jgi:hypothetical protein
LYIVCAILSHNFCFGWRAHKSNWSLYILARCLRSQSASLFIFAAEWCYYMVSTKCTAQFWALWQGRGCLNPVKHLTAPTSTSEINIENSFKWVKQLDATTMVMEGSSRKHSTITGSSTCSTFTLYKRLTICCITCEVYGEVNRLSQNIVHFSLNN